MSCLHNKKCDGAHNRSIDGTGIIPSSNDITSPVLIDLIDLFSSRVNVRSIVDIGCGIGYLVKHLNETGRYDAVGLEGSSKLAGMAVCDLNSIAVCDLSIPIDESSKYDLCVSIEMMEHVPREMVQNVLTNVSKLCRYFLCSIHVMNEEDDNHCTILNKNRWVEMMIENNLYPELVVDTTNGTLHETPEGRIISRLGWECSVFVFSRSLINE